MDLPDLTRSRAILIGNGSYAEHPRIPELPGARACVQAMTALLTGPLCGWPTERITSLVDLAVPSELAVRVVETVRDAEDVLLVYYVGHGMRTFDGQLALALAGTRPHPETLRHTAMLYPELASILRGARAPTKLVILDCCHAELGHRANYVFQSADLAEAYPVDGLYFIGASGRDAKAKAPVDGGLTYFTDAFITTVTAGIPRQPPTLRLDQIFLELRARLLRANLPEPVEAGTRGAHQFPFARNAAPPKPIDEADAEISALKAQAAERERELARLKQQLASAQSHGAGQQRELQDAVDDVSRQLDETRAAQAHLTTAGFHRPGIVGTRDSPRSGIASHTAGPKIKPPSGPGPLNAWRPRRLWLQLPARKRMLAVAVAALIATATAFIVPSVQGNGVPSVRGSERPGPASTHSPTRAPSPADTPSPGSTHSPTRTPPPANLAYTLTDPNGRGVDSLAFSPNGTTLAVGDGDADTYLWNTATHKTTTTLTDPARGTPGGNYIGSDIRSVAFAPNGTTLAASDDYGHIYLWNTATHKTTTLTNPGASNSGASYFSNCAPIAFAPNSTTLAIGDCFGDIYLWNTTTREITSSFTTPGGSNGSSCVDSVAFAPNGSTLAIGDCDGDTYLWSTTAHQITTTLTDPLRGNPDGEPQILSVAFSPNSATLAVSDDNSSIYLWNTETHKITATLIDPGGNFIWVNSVAFSPSGSILATGDEDGNTYLWNTATHKITTTFTDPDRHGISSVAFAPNGNTLATGDNNTYLWNTAGHGS